MRQLFLHVGMHKTGTSSIQETLHHNQPVLAEAGYAYLDQAINHSRLVYSAFAEAPQALPANRRAGIANAAAGAVFAATCRDQLLAFLGEAKQDRLILSGEAISLLGDAETEAMLQAFRARVDRIMVIGFVRPPRSFIVSAYQQRIRGGRSGDTISGRFARPQYRRRFEKYLGVDQGNDCLAKAVLQVYARAELRRGCSIATLLALVGAPEDLYGRLELRQQNAAVSRLTIALCLAANEAVPMLRPDGSRNPGRAAGLAPLFERLGGPRFELPAAILETHLHEHREDIAWMEKALGRRFADIEPSGPAAAPLASRDVPAVLREALSDLDGDELRQLVAGLNTYLLEADVARRPRPS